MVCIYMSNVYGYRCSLRENCTLENLGITVNYRVKVRLILGFGCRSVLGASY